VKVKCGVDAHIHIIHDETAAAALHAEESQAAVLVIGTAIGVGFPSERTEGLRALGKGF